jgi:hypothetical protein
MTRVSQSRITPSEVVEIATVCVAFSTIVTIVVADYDNADYVHNVCCFFTFLLYNKVRVLVS